MVFLAIEEVRDELYDTRNTSGEITPGALQNSGLALDESGHDTTGILNTERKRSDIEKKALGLFRSVARKNGGLDNGAIGNGLIGVDDLVGLLAVEEVRHELYDTGNTSGGTNKDNVVDAVPLSILQSRNQSRWWSA